jgi:hypothetical protein
MFDFGFAILEIGFLANVIILKRNRRLRQMNADKADER